MRQDTVHSSFSEKLVMLGFGSIGIFKTSEDRSGIANAIHEGSWARHEKH